MGRREVQPLKSKKGSNVPWSDNNIKDIDFF
jgi:hypothetical protein